MTDTFNVVLTGLYKYENMGLRIMHSLLEDIQDVQVSSIYLKQMHAKKFTGATQKEFDLFGSIISGEFTSGLKTGLVGISVMSAHVPIARQLTKLVRENSEALVIWGGIHPTMFPEESIQEADLICRGEGEEAIAELVTNLKDGKEFSAIKNLWINDSGRIVHCD